MTISVRRRSFLRDCRSLRVRLSRMRVGLAVMTSSSTESMYMSRSGSRFAGGHHVLLSRKGLGSRSQLISSS